VKGEPLDVGKRATPEYADINGDGKRDLIIGNLGGYILIYPNVGTNSEPSFNNFYLLKFNNGKPVHIHSRTAPRLYDWDRDGRIDLLTGEVNGGVYFLRNTGTNSEPVFKDAVPVFKKDGTPLKYTASMARSRLSVADWDNDGTPDILLGGVDGRIMLFRGTGDILHIRIKDLIFQKVIRYIRE